MQTVQVTLGQLIDAALEEVQSAAQVGNAVVLDAPISDTDGSLTLTVGNPQPTDLLEFGSELLMVTAVTPGVPVEYSVNRGYFNTTKAAHAGGTAGELNPLFNRQKAGNAVRRAFARIEALGVPLVKTATLAAVEVPDTHRVMLEVPSDARTVLTVRTEGLYDLEGWEHVDYVPTSVSSTGQVIRLPRQSTTDSEYTVVYRTPYRWSNFPDVPEEDSTIEVLEGTEDLPSAYAAAWLVSSREVSRQEVQKAGEWPEGEPSRGGVSATLVRAKWQEFYRALDEARRLDPPRVRPSYYRRHRGV